MCDFRGARATFSFCAEGQWVVQLSILSSRGSLPEPDTSQEGGVISHVDECVFMGYAYGNLLASAEWAHPSRVAGVELALACLDAAGAAEERTGVHHHIIAGDVSEVEVVHFYLTIYEVDTVQQHL